MTLKSFSNLLATLPAIFLTTLINVFVCSATASMVMVLLLSRFGFCQAHSWIALAISILTAVGVWGWIAFNHKLTKYVDVRSCE